MGLIDPAERKKGQARGVAALVAVGVVALVILFLPFLSPPKFPESGGRQESILVQAKKTAEIMSCQAEIERGLVPAFDSTQMPSWWSRHSKGLILDRDVAYQVPKEIWGKKMNELAPNQTLLTATGKAIKEAFGTDTISIRADGRQVF